MQKLNSFFELELKRCEKFSMLKKNRANIVIRLQIFVLCLLLNASICNAISLGEFVQSSDFVSSWSGYVQGNCFHCTDKKSIVSINKKVYEISTFRINGITDKSTYKNFGEVVSKLGLADLQSETKNLYADFPDLEFELWNIKLKDDAGNVVKQILIALRKHR